MIGHLSGKATINGGLTGIGGIAGRLGKPNSFVPPYEGNYTVTPSGNVVTLPTSGLYMEHDVIVYAIESMSEQAIRRAVAAGWEE